jgi:hypothetical protein
MTGLTAGTDITLMGDRTGYVNARLRTGVAITSGLVTGPSTDALPKARSAGDATVTLDWKNTQPIANVAGCLDACNGWEFDLIVKLPSGTYIDPMVNPGDLLTSPFVKNPRDSFNDFQPLETIVIGSAAANGQYRVVVDKLPFIDGSFNPSFANSQASVQLYNGAASIGTFFGAPPATCMTQRFWHVGNLTKSDMSYTWSTVNTCTDTRP